jgi:hypothetical protein
VCYYVDRDWVGCGLGVFVCMYVECVYLMCM